MTTLPPAQVDFHPPTPLVINISDRSIVNILSTLEDTLSESEDDQFSITICNLPGVSSAHRINAVLEAIAIRSVMHLLQNSMHLVEELVVQTMFRSSLREAPEPTNGYPATTHVTTYYMVDDGATFDP